MKLPPSPLPSIALTAALLGWGLVPESLAPAWASRVRGVLKDEGLNRADIERMERGYYETLLDAGRRFDQIEQDGPTRDSGGHVAIPLDAGPLARDVDDLREYVLKPDLSIEHWGVRWTTNARGMRDRPYETTRPAGTLRIALIGDSIGAGWGVDDGRGFEPLMERALDERSRAAGGPAVEILNYAVPGHAPGQRWENFLRSEGWETGTDLVLYEATPADPGWDERRLRGLLPRGLGWDAPQYRPALDWIGVRPGGDSEEYAYRLKPYRWEILKGVYRAIADDCRARGVPAVWVLIPRIGKPIEPGERDRLLGLARDAGFSAVIDLTDIFEGDDPRALAIGPSDYHPNAEGHARLARRLEAELGARPEWIRLRSGHGTRAEGR